MSAEWKTVERKKSRATKHHNITSDVLVKEILSALLANRAYKPQAREPEWKCKNCEFSNFATRYKCRACLKPRQTGRATNAGIPPNVQ